jgi:hypothetical protein
MSKPVSSVRSPRIWSRTCHEDDDERGREGRRRGRRCIERTKVMEEGEGEGEREREEEED